MTINNHYLLFYLPSGFELRGAGLNELFLQFAQAVGFRVTALLFAPLLQLRGVPELGVLLRVEARRRAV